MEGLPLLPGYAINDPSKNYFAVPHNFDWKNGYPIAKKPWIGVGGEPLDVESVLYQRTPDPVRYDPSLTYGRSKSYVPPIFQPHYLLYANKCLTFKAYFKQSVIESPEETYRVRIVNIIYFLEDDSITVMEPKVENSGIMQGRIVKRSRIPKSGSEDYWHWKDFNLGMDMEIYGVLYHICDCDTYTKGWLESQGVELDMPEELPKDFYTEKRKITNQLQIRVTPNFDEDKLKRFLDFDKRVLRFFAVWDRRMEENGTLGKYKIHYYLADDTIDIYENQDLCEVQTFGTRAILKKAKVPKDTTTVPSDNSPIIQEPSSDELVKYYSAADLIVGKTVFIFGRRFYIYDCDDFTRSYYRKIYNIQQPKLEIPEAPEKETVVVRRIPPYTGFGSHWDSMLSHYHLDPKSVKVVDKMEFIRYLQCWGMRLRYTAEMDHVHPEDEKRQFVMEYRLSDGHIMVHEIKQRNSGFVGGRFLKHSLVAKPGSNPDNPEYYSPHDFRLGSVVEIYGHRFRITGVDLAVYRYMEANPEKFTDEMVSEVRKYLVREGHLTEDIKHLAEFRKREEIAEPVMDTYERSPDQQDIDDKQRLE